MLTKVRLERLKPEHEAAVLAFEQESRAYFARSISDRGDAYFAEFPARHRALLAEQETGTCHFHVIFLEGDTLRDHDHDHDSDHDDGAPAGRINLVNVADGAAELGYRIAEWAAGRGVATAAVDGICRLAAAEYGLTALVADTALENQASRTVLERNGFAVVGETTVGAGRPAVRYRRPLAP